MLSSLVNEGVVERGEGEGSGGGMRAMVDDCAEAGGLEAGLESVESESRKRTCRRAEGVGATRSGAIGGTTLSTLVVANTTVKVVEP